MGTSKAFNDFKLKQEQLKLAESIRPGLKTE